MSQEILGEIVVIKRNGNDGARFPLKQKQCTFGRDSECDIRIQIPQVEEEHAKIFCENGKIWLQNLSTKCPTLLNSRSIDLQEVNHNDLFTITQRSFRFEFPEGRKPGTPRSSTKTPLKALQGSPRTPSAGEPLKTSITKLRRNSSTVLEEKEPNLSPFIARENSSKLTKIKEKENTPEDDCLADTPSILRRKDSAKRSDKKRISFGPTLSPEIFDKTLPPSTPLRKGRSPARRLSEPFKGVSPGASIKKRCSLGTGLGKMPIMEEEDEEDAKVVDLCQTPPPNLQAPLQPARAINSAEGSNAKETYQPVSETNEDAVADVEEKPKKKIKQDIIVKGRQLATPIRRQIHKGMVLKKKRKIATPLRKDIERKPALRKTKRMLATPVRESIKKGVSLRATKKKLQTPLREDIQKGTKLRQTKPKLQTPLREDIQKGTKLRQTKPKLPTPLQEEIKSKPALRETRMKMRRSLQDEIIKGVQLHSKFASIKTAPEELLEDIKKGKELKKVMKSAPTPLKTEIKKGVKLRETKRNMRKSLQNEIIKGKSLRKTKLSAPTPLRKAIKEGKRLRKTKPSAPTPLRKAIKDGKKLRKTKKTAPTPLREAIKHGVSLRKTKKKLDEDLQAEIKKGTTLKKTKMCAPTPLRNEIKTGVSLRKTKKKLNSNLLKEIQDGKELRKTKKSAPTPFKNEIKKGKKLRVTKKVLRQSLQNEIKAGVKLVPQLKKALKTPIRNQIKAGVTLRRKKTADAVCEATNETEESKAEILSIVDGIECVTATVFENKTDAKKSNRVAESGYGQQDKKRPILRATRKISKKNEVVAMVVQEAPRRRSAKIEKPAKKRICRRSTPKKMVELRENLQADGDKDHDIVGAIDSDATELMSPVITFPASEAVTVVHQSRICQNSGAYLNETSCEDLSLAANIPGIPEGLDTTEDISNNSANLDLQDADKFLGLRQMMKTPKAERKDVLEHDLGLKRLMKTPGTGKLETPEVQSNLGLKRLMKTPKVNKQDSVEEHLGLQRLMKTPKMKNAEPVEETFGLARLYKTSKENVDETPEVDSNLGLKRILRTPKTKGEAVEENLGLKRLMTTPKQNKGKALEIEGNLGLNRLMQTPKEQVDEAMEIDGEFGLQRLMRSSKAKNPPLGSPHLDGLFHDMREKKTKEAEVEEKFGLKRLMATPKDDSKRVAPKYSLDAGALPSLFHLRKEEKPPIEVIQLQDVFFETDQYNGEKLTIEPEVSDSPVLEDESTIGTRRRGKKKVTQEAPRTRSTRSTRENKEYALIPIEDDAEDCGQKFSSEDNSGTPDLSATIENVEPNERTGTKVMKGKNGRGRAPKAKPTEPKEKEMEAPPTKRRKTRATKYQEVIVIDLVTDQCISTDNSQNKKAEADHDSSAIVPASRRSTRNCPGVVAKNTSVRGRRASRSANTVDVKSSCVVLLEQASIKATSMEQVKADEGMPNETIRSSRSRSKRKANEQVEQNASGSWSRTATRANSQPDNSQKEIKASEAMPMPGQRGRRRKVNVADGGTAGDDAGLTKGMVKTPPKVKFMKTGLYPILEEKESHVITPYCHPTVTDTVPNVPTKLRTTRGRKRDILAEKEAEETTEIPNTENQDDTSTKSPVKNDDLIVTEQIIRATRSRKTSSDAELHEKPQCMKKKLQTRYASKQEPPNIATSTEEQNSRTKRQKQAQPTERSTRRSARLRHC